MARGMPSTAALVVTTVCLGVLAGVVVVKEMGKPMDATRLIPRTAPVQQAGGPEPRGRLMVASRRAVAESEAPVTFQGVLSRLFSPRPPPYLFREEFYVPRAPHASLDEDAGEQTGAGAPAADAPAEGGEAPAGDGEPAWDDDWENQDVHLWSEGPPGAEDDEGDVQIWDIITYDLPLFVFFLALLLYVEISACLWRRQRDFLLSTAAWRGNDDAFRAQCAKESQVMSWRVYATWFASLGLWMVVKDAMDVYGKCFFNIDCFLNVDCHVRILIPSEFECVFDVMLPAAVVAGIMICGILAAVWGFTRPWAALVLLGTFATGLFAIWTVSQFVCILWLLAAVGFTYFYFAMLPYVDDSPEWCEDLGSLAFASNPQSGAMRDGEKAQHWKENPDGALQPTRSELETLQWFERVTYHVADFYHTHLRSLRVLWNGVLMRGLVLAILGRRIRVFGEEHVKHLGSHDKVLVAANHRTFFDFWVITVCGLWAKAGASFFSFYPVRTTWFYTNFGGLLMNLGFSSFAMFPPIMNTPSDKKKEQTRVKEHAHKWNDFAIRRVISDLKMPGVICGIHPEGTRNKDPDPYNILPTRPGVGRVALESPDAHVVPVFVLGVENDVWAMFKKNWADSPLEEPVDVVFGPHIDFGDLREKLAAGSDTKEKLWAEAGDRVTEAIRGLAAAHPRLASEFREREESLRNMRYQGHNVADGVASQAV